MIYGESEYAGGTSNEHRFKNDINQFDMRINNDKNDGNDDTQNEEWVLL